MKILSHVALALALVAPAACAQKTEVAQETATARPETVAPPATSLYELRTRTLEGEAFDLAQLKGKVALVVNVASKCGLTPQYEGLEKLHAELSGQGFTVLGFPSNDFMGQEPGSPAEIREFCSSTYGVTFPMFEKVAVKGEQKAEIYRFLCAQQEEPSWNFTKYLVDHEGNVLARFDPRTAPDDAGLREAILAALAARSES